MSKKQYTRLKRRRSRAQLQHGRAAGPRHKLKTGRTGNVHAKKTPKKTPGLGLVRREFAAAFKSAWASVRKLLER